MSALISLLPRPVRDIVGMAPFIGAVVSGAKSAKDGSGEAAIFGLLGGLGIRVSAMKMIKASCRIALVGIAAIALSGKSLAVAAIVGSFVSLPAAVIAGGGMLLLNGYNAVSVALATGSLISTGSGLLYLAAGYIVLEIHDLIELGLVDSYFIQPFALENSPTVAKAFIK